MSTAVNRSPIKLGDITPYLTYGPVGDHILQEFNTLYLTRFKTYKKLLNHPKLKPRRGGGLRQINTCRKVPLQVNFFR
jgi:hypothetical protein